MCRLAESLSLLVIALWVGGTWAIGFVAAPALFSALDDRALAGEVAGTLFGLIDRVGIACAAFLLLHQCVREGRAVLVLPVFWIVLAMLLLILAGHFGVQPVLADLKAEAWPRSVMQSAAKDRFVVWHGVAGGLYALQGVLGAALVLLQGRRPRSG